MHSNSANIINICITSTVTIYISYALKQRQYHHTHNLLVGIDGDMAARSVVEI